MKIFLPFKKDLNPYLDKVIENSEHSWVYGKYVDYNDSYDSVNIHWPEAIFSWAEPTARDLKKLQENILKWKKNSVLIYTKHDYQRNKGTTRNFTELFKLIELHADVFIHLGQHSKKLYEQKYPNVRHEIVYHPSFEGSVEVFPKIFARKELNIDQDALVIIAPGNIRSHKERELVLQSFHSIEIKNKVLISTNMRSELKVDFPGRVRLKKYFNVQKFFIDRFRKKYLPPQYIFSYSPLSSNDLSLRMSASDIVMVPRIDILNSGIVFLGLTFGKIMVGPAVGNIKEQLEELDYPVFDPKSIYSVVESLKKAITLFQGEKSGRILPAKYSPENVAMEYDRILLKYRK